MLNTLRLKNYRNIRRQEIIPDKHVTTIIAPNGSGKTNILEALYYTIFRTSFRPLSSYTELVGPHQNFTNAVSQWHDETYEVISTIETEPHPKRTITANGSKKRRVFFHQTFPLILFAPHSVSLTSGVPAGRRQDLDAFLSIYHPDYTSTLSTYTKLLKNRNAVIKAIQEKHAQESEINYWNKALGEVADTIHHTRAAFFAACKSRVQEVSSQLYHDIQQLSLVYEPNKIQTPQDSYVQILSENMQKEIIVGRTLYGPHKDDFSFHATSTFGTQDLRYHGSRGQQRIGSFIYKLAQYHLYREKYPDMDPLLLLDDIMSELDSTHRKHIAEYLLQLDTQIIITGADEKEIPYIMHDAATRISLT